MEYLPIFAQIKNRPVLMVGGGNVAMRKIALLLKAGAIVHVIAKKLHADLHAQLNDRLMWIGQHFEEVESPDALFPYYLIYSATNDKDLNQRVKNSADKANIFVNVVDQMAECSFITPSIVDRSPLIVAVSSGGKTPVLTRLVREKLEKTLSFSLGDVARIAGEYRDIVRAKITDVVKRRRFWETIFEQEFTNYIENNQTDKAINYLNNAIELQDNYTNQGQVILVGAGPGDPALLTIGALHAMQKADVVLYDYLVSPKILDLVRRDAQLICVGKRAGNHLVSQEITNQLLVEHALQGKTVVRLKGGDPFIFGRGAEELAYVKQHGIEFKIVPGITAAIGACSYAGIPLTHRDYSQSVHFITGHCRAEGDLIHWQSLAQSGQTICVYMGAIKASDIAHQLIRHGLAQDTPVAVISSGTNPDQLVVIGDLVNLPNLVNRSHAPILIVIGDVVKCHQQLAWFNTGNIYTRHL